ncbi:MAG: hypothetical protein MK297_06515 [Planctomycetes bacterium]|nr:hypothetical protein [Planctomycetota bacterium]
MKTTSALLSPRDLAQAMGVSESSVKRWADDGKIMITRTEGGHRKIQREEAVRFIRERGMEVPFPQHLGLGAVSGAERDEDSLNSRLKAALIEGDLLSVQAVVTAFFLAGWSIASIFDGPFSNALREIGELWRETPEDGILIEHRSTTIAINAFEQLRSLLPPTREDAPLAIGGAFQGDPTMLPSLVVASVLESQGFRTVNLGGNTPTSIFKRAAELHDPSLVWLSINHVTDSVKTSAAIEELVSHLNGEGRQVVIGGRGLKELSLRQSSGLFFSNTTTEIEAYTKGLGAKGGRA